MNDETSAPAKRKGGWPAGKPRGKKSMPEVSETPVQKMMRKVASERRFSVDKMKSRPNWDSNDFVGVGVDGADRLHIDPTLIKEAYRDGFAFQWVTKSVRGQETPQELAKITKGGWTPVEQSDFDGVFDGMFMPKGADGPIVVDDCMLVTRDVGLHEKAVAARQREATAPVRIAEAALGTGIPGVTGSNHPSAVRGNSIKKTMERIEIPE